MAKTASAPADECTPGQQLRVNKRITRESEHQSDTYMNTYRDFYLFLSIFSFELNVNYIFYFTL